ncbi:MAG TPA: DHA2 family efflux MFS transporter permease subunit [Acidimicrobiales bacterium]
MGDWPSQRGDRSARSIARRSEPVSPSNGAAGWRQALVEPRRPAWVRDSPKAYWYAVAAVCLGAFMGQLDASIVTLAFPSLHRDFNAGLGVVTWVGLSYLTVLVALVVPVGRLADMVGRKLLYTYGFVVFVVGSVLCGLAPTLTSLVGFRVLQAIGAAMLQANSVAIIALAMPKEMLGRAIGVQGAAQALGLALGPSLGGLLIAVGGWRLIFFVNVPAGIAGAILGWLFIPRSRELQRRVRFDWTGLGLFVPAVVALLVAVSLGNELGWMSSLIVGLLGCFIALMVAFVVHERRASAPIVDSALFRRMRFSAALGAGLLSYLVLFGTLFVVPFYLERALGMGVGQAGLELTVMAVLLGLIAPLAGRAADRWSARPLTVLGMLLVATSLAVLGLDQPGTAERLGALVVLGAGLGLFTPPNNAAIMATAPRSQAGMASGILNMTRGLGTAMGLAFTSLVFGSVAGSQLSPGSVTQGFEASTVFLAVVAVVAASLAAVGGRGPNVGRPAPAR